MHSAFERMSKGVLAVLGQDSFLRGEPTPYRVNVEHGVQIIGEDDNVTVLRDVATIPEEANPRVGDRLVHPDGTYRLDAEQDKNGVNRSFILLKIAS